MCDPATPPAPSYLDLEMTVTKLRAQLAAAEKERDLLRERLDQFEAYAMPNVATALDRIAAAESRAERMAKLLREAHPVVFHAANLMTGEMARAEAGRLANRIRAVLAEVGK